MHSGFEDRGDLDTALAQRAATGAEPASRDVAPPGLSSDAAARLLAAHGPNATPDVEINPLRLILGKFLAPVPSLLLIAIVLQLVLRGYIEAGIIAALLVFNAVLGFVHEGHAQATLKALKSRLALWASVRRDGKWRNIPAAELVPGDIVKLSLGSVVAADAYLVSGGVMLDRSMLTGESMPVEAGPGQEVHAGALVRRGEAVARITATGTRTKFGRTAELVRTAHVTSSQQKAVLQVVKNLAVYNGSVTLVLTAYAWWLAMPFMELVPLILIAVLGSIPVALPAAFTLATAIGAHALASRGVLPTRLSAIDEAATMQVLCADKTGTLTCNELSVGAVWAMPGFAAAGVLALAALASSEAGQDPVDAAIRAAAPNEPPADLPRLIGFVPFDPATKMSEATALGPDGAPLRIAKGAFTVIASLSQPSSAAGKAASELEARGFRVLGVALGEPGRMRLAGLVALGDPPRAEAAACIAELRQLGVRVVMVTGDAPATAAVVASAVGLGGAVCPPGPIPHDARPEDFAVFAGVMPEDKYRLVQAFQRSDRVVGMCGDGANDAPALRQAHLGVAVSTATDVAKSAAGIVLTEPGLAGIVTSVREGRVTFQRILTYTLGSLVHKTRQVSFLAIGLAMTGHAILTPLLVVISMITADFLTMSSTTDNVHPSPVPNTWRIGSLTIAGLIIGLCDLAFCVGVLAVGHYELRLDIEALRTLILVTLVFSGQAIFYVVRERRRMWASRPSLIVIAASLAGLLMITILATHGILMAPLSGSVVAGLFAASIALALVLDQVKVAIFAHLKMQ